MQKNKCNNILIINDSATLNILLKLTLEAEGYLIEISETGIDGLAKAGLMEFQLILLDYILPDIDGLEVCRKLREGKITEHTPIAFLTSLDEADISEKIQDAGADAYIDPPFKGKLFMDRIKELIKC